MLGVKTYLINKDLLARSKELFNYRPSSPSSSDTSSSSFIISNTTGSSKSTKSIKNTSKTSNSPKKVSFTDKVRYIHPPYEIENGIEKNKKKKQQKNSVSITINGNEKENSIPTSPSRSTLEKSTTTITNSFSNYNSQNVTSPSHISSETDDSTKITKKITTNKSKNNPITRIEDKNMKLTIKSPKVNIRIRPLQDILDEQKNIDNKMDKSETVEESSTSTSSFYTSLHHTPSSILYNNNNNTTNPLNASSQFISDDNLSNQNPSFFKNTSLYSSKLFIV